MRRPGGPSSTDHRQGIHWSLVKKKVRTRPPGHSHPYRQDAAGSWVLGWVAAGPGSGLSEELVWGCEPAALESESLPWLSSRARPFARHVAGGVVVYHGPGDDVGHPPFEVFRSSHAARSRCSPRCRDGSWGVSVVQHAQITRTQPRARIRIACGCRAPRVRARR